jgi:hypothetical protein
MYNNSIYLVLFYFSVALTRRAAETASESACNE